MSTVQERLQLKRAPLDTWNIREQLCLASAVVTSGDQNWMSVSRTLKTIGDPNRPVDWYSQKSCAAQYGQLLEHVETPKRKKRNSDGTAGETPQESILKKLTQERIAEIEKSVEDYNQQYQTLQNELSEIRNPATSEDRLKEMWAQVEAANRARERESARRAAWLREREERRARAERPWRTSSTEGNVAAAPQPSSPLLTSLLKSSPVVTTPQHIPHPANVVDSISPSAGAPTLSMLLEKSSSERTPQHETNKLAAIEHIKSQLVQFEQQFIQASTSSAQTRSAPASLDIDDIEIKAEDVYAFRDIDLHIPTHKVQRQEKTSLIGREEHPLVVSDLQPIDNLQSTEENIQMDQSTTDASCDEIINIDNSNSQPSEPMEETTHRQTTMSQRDVEVELKIAFPEVKFPNPEIKVIQADEIKEELIDPEPTQREDVRPTSENIREVAPSVEQNITTTHMEVEEDITPAQPLQEVTLPPPVVETTPVPVEVVEPTIVEEVVQEIALPTVVDEDAVEQTPTEQPTPEHALETSQEELSAEPIEQLKVEPTEQLDESQGETEQNMSSVLEIEDLSMAEIKPEAESDAQTQDGADSRVYDTQTETDDDTPMEFPREEDKDGKKRRDYTRRKKPESRTCSGSESAAETDSPTPDANKQHRLWKKSVMLVYSRLSAHKYASLFLRPISDEQAPGYSTVVKRPMDLSSIKRNIDTGVIRSTAEFHRDILLMLSNALMYNSSRHRVYECARDLFKEAQNELSMLLSAQAHASLESPAAGPRRRRHQN